MEQEPKFEGQKEVPWDESIIPPDKRELLRELNDPQKQEEFWKSEFLDDPDKSSFFETAIYLGLDQVGEEYKVLYDTHGLPNFSKNDELDDKIIDALKSRRFPYTRATGGNLYSHVRQEEEVIFNTQVKFLKDNGVPAERLLLGRFIAEGYKREAKKLESYGIDPRKNYPFEESTQEAFRNALKNRFRNSEKELGDSANVQESVEKEINLDFRESLSTEKEQEMARQGEKILKNEMLYKPFEERYQELKKKRKK